MTSAYTAFDAPFGQIFLVADDFGIKNVFLSNEEWQNYLEKNNVHNKRNAVLDKAVQELSEYFEGKRKQFSVPLSLNGTEFCKSVWEELIKIPFGETRSYQDIAEAIGKPKACRAVGQANRRNPIPLFIPCHRVLGKDGSLTGFMGKEGLKIKAYLLDLEKC